MTLTLEIISATVNLKNCGLRKKFQIKAPDKTEWNGIANIPVPDSTTNVLKKNSKIRTTLRKVGR